MSLRLTLLALAFAACGPDRSAASTTTDSITSATQANCPATWPDARKLCDTAGCTGATRCIYPHMGDQLGPSQSDWADAVLGCFDATDAGIGEWRCAQ